MPPWRLAATCLGIGRLRPAPGTIASLFATITGLGLGWIGGVELLAACALLVFTLGWWAAGRHRLETGTDDDPEVVIDEVTGQWIALVGASGDFLLVALAFVLFRAFDILKPFPISWIDSRMKGGLGTMLDDVMAGGAALACTFWAGVLLHG